MTGQRAYGMSMEDILRSAQIATRTGEMGTQFVHDTNRDVWHVQGMMGLVKPFTTAEMRHIVEIADLVVVRKDFGQGEVYIVRDNRSGNTQEGSE
jgi:hypothetical protein